VLPQLLGSNVKSSTHAAVIHVVFKAHDLVSFQATLDIHLPFLSVDFFQASSRHLYLCVVFFIQGFDKYNLLYCLFMFLLRALWKSML